MTICIFCFTINVYMVKYLLFYQHYKLGGDENRTLSELFEKY